MQWLDVLTAVLYHRRKRGRFDMRGVSVLPHVCSTQCKIAKPWDHLHVYVCLDAGVIAHECMASHQTCDTITHTRGMGDVCVYSGLVLSPDCTIQKEDSIDMLRRGLMSYERPVSQIRPTRAPIHYEAANVARSVWNSLLYSQARLKLDAGVAQRIKNAMTAECAFFKRTGRIDIDRVYAFVVRNVTSYHRYVYLTAKQRQENDVRASLLDTVVREFEAIVGVLARTTTVNNLMLPSLFLAFVYERDRKWRQNRPPIGLDYILPRIRDLDSIGIPHPSMQAHASLLDQHVNA